MRHRSIISRQSDLDFIGSAYAIRYNSILDKEAVQPYKNDNIYEQINQIMNGARSKHNSVEAAVAEMKQRSGLTDYLNNMNKQSADTTDNKIASAQDKSEPDFLAKNPQIIKTLENIIRDSKGQSSIPAILLRLQSIHCKDASDKNDWEDERLIRLISKLNLKEKASNPERRENLQNLGLSDNEGDTEIDPSNIDAFHMLMPNKQ